MKKENATACTNKQKKCMETEKQTTQNTLNKDNVQASITASSEEDCKPQTSQVEEKPTEDEPEKNAEEKSEEEKMEVDSETTTSSGETGKCLKLNFLSFYLLEFPWYYFRTNICFPSTDLSDSFLQIKLKTKALPRLLCSLRGTNQFRK